MRGRTAGSWGLLGPCPRSLAGGLSATASVVRAAGLSFFYPPAGRGGAYVRARCWVASGLALPVSAVALALLSVRRLRSGRPWTMLQRALSLRIGVRFSAHA